MPIAGGEIITLFAPPELTSSVRVNEDDFKGLKSEKVTGAACVKALLNLEHVVNFV